MKPEYDFSKSSKNPHAKQLKRQVTIRLDTIAVNYFKETAGTWGCRTRIWVIYSCGIARCKSGVR